MPTSLSIDTRVMTVLARIFGTTNIPSSSKLFDDLLLDSIDLIEILILLKTEFEPELKGRDIDATYEKTIGGNSTIEALIDFMRAQIAA